MRGESTPQELVMEAIGLIGDYFDEAGQGTHLMGQANIVRARRVLILAYDELIERKNHDVR